MCLRIYVSKVFMTKLNCENMPKRTVINILKYIGRVALFVGSTWLAIEHNEAFTIDYYCYGYAVWAISIIVSHYNVLQNSRALLAAIARYSALALLLIPIILLLFEVLRYGSPYHSLKDIIINRAPIFGYIEIALYLGCLISGVLFYFKKKGTIYNPKYRIAFTYIIRITLLYCFILRAYWTYQLFLSPREFVWGVWPEFIPLHIKSSYEFTCCLCAGCFFRIYKNKQALFKIPANKRYVLYLRSFQGDKEIAVSGDLIKFYKSRDLMPVEVADPSQISENQSFLGYNIFLLSADWKKEVSYYIKHAESVILCVGYSDGVQWEMYSHLQYLNKYLFYVPSTSVLTEHISNIKQSYASNPVAEAIEKLRHFSHQNLYFVIKDDRCYYSEDFETLINRECLDGVLYVKLQTRIPPTITHEHADRKSIPNFWGKINLKYISVPIIACGPFIAMGLQANLSRSYSQGFMIFLAICYIVFVACIFAQVHEVEK